ncbi:MAG: thioredoxin family protein [Candidatus Saccharimonadales bacterium]
MGKKILIGIGLLLVVGAVAYLLLTKDRTGTHTTTQNTPQNTTSQAQSPPTDTTAEPGRYVGYTPDTLSTTSGTRLLFFHASWCPQCRALESSIQNGAIPSGITIIKVDYDNNQSLRQKYGVKLQTTVVKIDTNGNKVDSFVAYDDPSLSAVTERLL